MVTGLRRSEWCRRDLLTLCFCDGLCTTALVARDDWVRRISLNRLCWGSCSRRRLRLSPASRLHGGSIWPVVTSASRRWLSGRIDAYVEYTGTALTAILKQPLPPVGQRDASDRYLKQCSVCMSSVTTYRSSRALVLRIRSQWSCAATMRRGGLADDLGCGAALGADEAGSGVRV